MTGHTEETTTTTKILLWKQATGMGETSSAINDDSSRWEQQWTTNNHAKKHGTENGVEMFSIFSMNNHISWLTTKTTAKTLSTTIRTTEHKKPKTERYIKYHYIYYFTEINILSRHIFERHLFSGSFFSFFKIGVAKRPTILLDNSLSLVLCYKKKFGLWSKKPKKRFFVRFGAFVRHKVWPEMNKSKSSRNWRI